MIINTLTTFRRVGLIKIIYQKKLLTKNFTNLHSEVSKKRFPNILPGLKIRIPELDWPLTAYTKTSFSALSYMRMLRISWNFDSIPSSKQKLISLNIKHHLTLNDHANFAKRMSVFLNFSSRLIGLFIGFE